MAWTLAIAAFLAVQLFLSRCVIGLGRHRPYGRVVSMEYIGCGDVAVMRECSRCCREVLVIYSFKDVEEAEREPWR